MSFIAVFGCLLGAIIGSVRHDHPSDDEDNRTDQYLQCLAPCSSLLQTLISPDSQELLPTRPGPAHLPDLIRYFPDHITANLELAARLVQSEDPFTCILNLNTMDVMRLLEVAQYLQLVIPVFIYQSNVRLSSPVDSVILQAVANRFLRSLAQDPDTFADSLRDLTPLLDNNYRPELLYECFRILCSRTREALQSQQWDYVERQSSLSWQFHDLTCEGWQVFTLFFLPLAHNFELNPDHNNDGLEKQLSRLYWGYDKFVLVRNFQYYLSTFQRSDFMIPKSTFKLFLAIPLVMNLLDNVPNHHILCNICHGIRLAHDCCSMNPAGLYSDQMTLFIDSCVQELKSSIASCDAQKHRERFEYLGHVLRQLPHSSLLGFFIQFDGSIHWDLLCFSDLNKEARTYSDSSNSSDESISARRRCKVFNRDLSWVTFYVQMVPMNPQLDLPEHSSLLKTPDCTIGWIASNSTYQTCLD